MNSDYWTVRSYIKQDTCYIINYYKNTANRRKDTPQVVASVLAQDYPKRFGTRAPNYDQFGSSQGWCGYIILNCVERKIRAVYVFLEFFLSWF